MANTIRIYKTTDAEKLDERFSGDGEQLRGVYTSALQRYEQFGSQPLSEMVTALAGQPDVPWTAETAELFRSQFLPGLSGHGNVDAVLRNGYREAFQLALDHDPPVPLETFWVTGAGDDFEVYISDGRERVTAFMIVPGVAGVNGFPGGSTRAENKSWVVTSGDRTADDGRASQHLDGDVVKIEVSGAPA